MTEAQTSLYLDSMPISELSPNDRRAVLERIAACAVALVGQAHVPYRDVVDSLALKVKRPVSEASLGISYGVDEGYLTDEGVPSVLSVPNSPADKPEQRIDA